MDAKMTEVISKHSRRLKSYGPNAMNQYILGLDSMRLIVAAAESCAGLEAKCKGLDATNYLHTAEPEECSRCGDTLYTREGEWFGPEDDPVFVCFKCQRAELEAKCADLERLVWALRRGWIIRDVHLNGMNIRPTLRTPEGGPWTKSRGYSISGFLCDYDSTGTILLSSEARAAIDADRKPLSIEERDRIALAKAEFRWEGPDEEPTPKARAVLTAMDEARAALEEENHE